MIGIDAGTFHTVAVQMRGDAIRIPPRSVPSIALRGGGSLIVGVDAVLQLNSEREIVLAPKLRLSDDGKDRELLQTIIRKLVFQALQDLGDARPDAFVLTVPPGWTLSQCDLLASAIEPLGATIRFIHEPIAMILGAMHFSQKYDKDPRLTAKLDGAEQFLICDWGAGTVDVALVRVDRNGHRHEFSCLGQITELKHGGTAIARDVVSAFQKSGDGDQVDSVEKDAYRLQAHWAGEVSGDFSHYEPFSRERRVIAAEAVAALVIEMFKSLPVQDNGKILCVLHGGPLESNDLRSFLQQRLMTGLVLSDRQFIHIGNEFATGLPFDRIPMRRDALVASGAALFSAFGKTLPEFVYKVVLKKDAFGETTSSVLLATGPNLSGKQYVQPPYTGGGDYFVEVNQLRRGPDGTLIPTSIKKELMHSVRAGAIVQYCLTDAGVGFARIESTEVTDTLVPGVISDAKSDSVRFPESSTRFSIELE